MKQKPKAGTSSLTIRAAQLKDCPAIAGIYNQAIRSGRSTMHSQPVDATHFEKYLRHQQRESILVGESGSQAVAWGIVKQYSDREGYRYAGETSVYVAQACQGRGFGAQMQEAVMARAHQLGYRHLVARILAINDASIRFHQRFGFEIVGRQRAIGYLDGVWHDVVILQHVLEDRVS